MTTSKLAGPSLDLGDHLTRHARGIIRFDAVVTTLAGLEMVLLPSLFVRLHGLGSTPLWGARLLGVEWLCFGLWLLTLWNRPFTDGMAKLAIAVLGINAIFILIAALAFDLGFTPLGWTLSIGTILFMEGVCLTWWQVLRGRADVLPVPSRV